jgi:hypothetical protein
MQINVEILIGPMQTVVAGDERRQMVDPSDAFKRIGVSSEVKYGIVDKSNPVLQVRDVAKAPR